MASCSKVNSSMGTAYHFCAPLCNNVSRYDNSRELSFHKFPTDEIKRKEWIIKIRRDVGQSFRISDATRICSAHFSQSELRRSLNSKRCLRPGSVPSIFAWNSPVKRIRPQRRSMKKMLPAKVVEGSIEEEPELLSSSVDQTPAVSNDHDYTIHAPINDQLLAAQDEIMDLQRKRVTVKKTLFSLE